MGGMGYLETSSKNEMQFGLQSGIAIRHGHGGLGAGTSSY
jgi:hypothetical protein